MWKQRHNRIIQFDSVPHAISCQVAAVCPTVPSYQVSFEICHSTAVQCLQAGNALSNIPSLQNPNLSESVCKDLRVAAVSALFTCALQAAQC